MPNYLFHLECYEITGRCRVPLHPKMNFTEIIKKNVLKRFVAMLGYQCIDDSMDQKSISSVQE